MTYQEYTQRIHERNTNNTPDNDKYLATRKLNEQRMRRIEQTFTPSASVQTAMAKITEPQTWVIITEDWCGDSSQTLAGMYKIASLNPLVTVELYDRDTHPDLMNQYLTNGSKSIPKVVARDKAGEDLWVWGPRPQPAQDLFWQLKNAEVEYKEIQQTVHTWYAHDKLVTLQKEILERITSEPNAPKE